MASSTGCSPSATARSPLRSAVMNMAHSQGRSSPPGRLLKYSQPITPPKRAWWPARSGSTYIRASQGVQPPPLAGFVMSPTTIFSAGQTPRATVALYMCGELQSPQPQLRRGSWSPSRADATGARVMMKSRPKSARRRSMRRTAPARDISSSTSRSRPSSARAQTRSRRGA
ncbi:hypothetical protein RB595_001604 [Gaeumannomyces hyphopodioides]